MSETADEQAIEGVVQPALDAVQVEPVPVRASLGQLAAYFLRLGFTAFGGPAAHIAMMQDDLAERRRWIDKRYFLDMLGATQLVPGPNSTEMAIHIGYLHQGMRGLLVTGVCFILPAFLLVLAISLFYGAYGSLPQVQAIFYGIQPVVVAIVVVAVAKLVPGALKSLLLAAIAIAAAVTTLLTPINTVWVIVGGGAVTLLVLLLRRMSLSLLLIAPLYLTAHPGASVLRALHTAAVEPSVVEPSLWGLFRFFLAVGATAMGSGYVIASYFTGGLVERLGWLTSSQVVDAIAVGQMTPGPVFTSAAFAGYLVMAGPGNNVLAGMAGAAVSAVAIFLPSFLIVWLMAPWVARLRRSTVAGTFLDGVNAAVVGSIAATSVALLSASAVNLAAPVLEVAAGAYRVDLPVLVLFLAALLVMLRRPSLNSTWLIAAGALLGLLAQQFA